MRSALIKLKLSLVLSMALMSDVIISMALTGQEHATGERGSILKKGWHQSNLISSMGKSFVFREI